MPYHPRLAPLSLLALTLSVAAQADEARTALAQRLQERYPATPIERVQPSEIPGLYEVMIGRNPAYTDATGRYFVFGHLFDLQTQRDLTAERLQAEQRVAFAELPLSDAIRTIRGAGERVLAVFSDPDCPYCRRLEEELAKVDNLTVYTFAYPLESLHPQARDKLRVDDVDEEALGIKRRILHGRINHGEQYLAAEHRRQPTAYYCESSGVGQALRAIAGKKPLKIGILGLGAGTLATYGRSGDEMRMYEINEQVLDLARNEFSYLGDSKATIVPVLGDGRLMLEREPAQNFDLLAPFSRAGWSA